LSFTPEIALFDRIPKPEDRDRDGLSHLQDEQGPVRGQDGQAAEPYAVVSQRTLSEPNSRIRRILITTIRIEQITRPPAHRGQIHAAARPIHRTHEEIARQHQRRLNRRNQQRGTVNVLRWPGGIVAPETLTTLEGMMEASLSRAG
jgi:hypothetical protein